MIQGRQDTYFTIDELAQMIGRSPKTVKNWITEGKLHALHLVGVPMIAMSHLESLLTGFVPPEAKDGLTALAMLNRSQSP